MKEMITIKAKNAMEKELKIISPMFSVERSVIECSDGGKAAYIVYKHPCITGTREEIREKTNKAHAIVESYKNKYDFDSIHKIGYSVIQ